MWEPWRSQRRQIRYLRNVRKVESTGLGDGQRMKERNDTMTSRQRVCFSKEAVPQDREQGRGTYLLVHVWGKR